MTETRDQGSAAGVPTALAIGALFFLSGVAALVYQVAWQRLLALLSGVGSYSVAMIVAAFMGGIGIGSHWGGRKSARITPRQALRMFACLELGLAAFACLSPLVYYDLLHLRLGHLYGSRLVAGALHVLALLPPTALMGMSLPFLARATVADVAGASRTMASSTRSTRPALPWVRYSPLGSSFASSASRARSGPERSATSRPAWERSRCFGAAPPSGARGPRPRSPWPPTGRPPPLRSGSF